MRRTRVLYYLWEYPQLSQTYIKTELDALLPDFDILIVARRPATQDWSNYEPYEVAGDINRARELAEDFKPDVLHSHWLQMCPHVAQLSRAIGVPWTLRSHSFDSLWGGFRGRWSERVPVAVRSLQSPVFAAAIPEIRDDSCLGVLGFPFVVPRFRKAGIPAAKLHATFPVVDVARFTDRSPNGSGVLNCGATREKKGFDDFLEVATRVPSREFSLYALGVHDGVRQLAEQNEAQGSPVRLAPVTQPGDMPAEYKKNEWLLYTGAPKYRTVGWPVAVAEAQAAGVGVCMPDLGRDIRDYIGGAGFTFSSVAEAAEIVAKPYPAELRELGFEVAKRSDIHAHKHVLTDLWSSAISPVARGADEVRAVPE